MGGDAVFGDLVHAHSADLQLYALLAWTDHGGVDRAIIVPLRRRYVVLETPRDHRPGAVDNTESLVTVGQALHNHPESENVGKLLEPHRFPFHLPPYRISALAAARDPCIDAAIGKLFGQLLFNVGNQQPAALGE